jgi:spore germination cell wall hydrolase CwlJ-like protein
MLKKKTDIEEWLVWFIWFVAIYFLLFLITGKGFGAEPSLTKDQKVVAMTILGEARGEGKAGMYAVACVLQQRSINRKLTPRQVCLQNRTVKGKKIHQFSCWNDGKESHSLKTPHGIYAKFLAMNLHRLQLSYVKNADHYCTLRTHNYWTRKSEPVKIIGNHKFFKLR